MHLGRTQQADIIVAMEVLHHAINEPLARNHAPRPKVRRYDHVKAFGGREDASGAPQTRKPKVHRT
jgi:hypothetical protein